MRRVRRSEVANLFRLPGVRNSLRLRECRSKQPQADRSEPLHHEDVPVGAKRDYTETCFSLSGLVGGVCWTNLNCGPAFFAAHSSSLLLGDLFVIFAPTQGG
jgi:hypothetical protein